MAARACGYCGEPIGYEHRFFIVGAPGTQVEIYHHMACYERLIGGRRRETE